MPGPLCPAPGPWPLLGPAQQPSALASSGLISTLFFPFLLPQLPKLLALSSLNWFSVKSVFVPLLRPPWVAPGLLRPLPQRIPGPLPSLCAPPHPSAAARTCCGSSSLPPVARPTLRLTPWLSSPRLPGDCAGLCFLCLPPVSYCACGEGGRGAGASWGDGAGFLLPGPRFVGSSLCLRLRPLLPPPPPPPRKSFLVAPAL